MSLVTRLNLLSAFGLQAVRQSQASMLFQRKNSLAVAELREHLLLDSDQDVISWFTAYKLPFENYNGKLMLDKLPPLAGRGPGADVSQRFLQKARGMFCTRHVNLRTPQTLVYKQGLALVGQSLGDMISSKLAWLVAGQAPGPHAHSQRTIRHFGQQALGSRAAPGSSSIQNSDTLSSPQAIVPLTGFAAAKAPGYSCQRHTIPAAVAALPPSPVHAEQAAAAHVHAAEAAARQAAVTAAEQQVEQRADSERAAAVKAAAEKADAEHAAAVEAAKAAATRRLHREQEAMAIAAKEAAQKRAQAEAFYAAERLAKMNLDAEYVRYHCCYGPATPC